MIRNILPMKIDHFTKNTYLNFKLISWLSKNKKEIKVNQMRELFKSKSNQN